MEKEFNKAKIKITFPNGLEIEYFGIINFWEETRYETTAWTLEGQRTFTAYFTALYKKENENNGKKES